MKITGDLKNGNFNNSIKSIYNCDDSQLSFYQQRFEKLIDMYGSQFGEANEIRLFSAPGRTEIAGNHTDHQHGHVMAASVNLDVIAAVSLNNSDEIRIKSEGYNMDIINIRELEKNESEYNKAIALIRGVVARFKGMGYEIKGFNAYTTSNVLKGSGLSSSAAFEVLVGNILTALFANNEVNAVEIAKIGQYAENEYFNKPCGMMDQIASSVGGVVAIDFEDTDNPVVEKIDFNLDGYSLCIIDSGADHADLTDDYGAITKEMKAVSEFFGKKFLRQVDENEFYKSIAQLKTKVSERAIIRAIHYFEDDRRAQLLVEMIKNKDTEGFKKLIIESGHSSFMYLQNVFSISNPENQAVSLVLAICEKYLKNKGAYRVHGGGFAGTIQAFVPDDMVAEFKEVFEVILGKNMCHVLNIRPVGGCEITMN